MIHTLNTISDHWFTWQFDMLWQTVILIAIIWIVDLCIRKWAHPQLRYALWLLILVKLIIPPTWTSPVSFTSHIPNLARKAALVSLSTETEVPIEVKKPAVMILTPETLPAAESLQTPKEPAVNYVQNPTRAVSKTIADTGRQSSGVSIAGREIPLKTEVETITGSRSDAQEISVFMQISYQSYGMLAWFAGVGILTVWLVRRLSHLRKEHLSIDESIAHKNGHSSLPEWFDDLLAGTAEKLHVKRLPRVVLTDKVACPAVFGLLRPVLLIPAGKLRHMTKQDTEHILLHELAHIKRGDLVVHAVSMTLHILYWCNPLLWLIRRPLQNLRELCCDATVARLLKDNTFRYRETLLETARQLLAEPVDPGLGLLGLFENNNWLITRLAWLEKNTWKNRKLRIAAIITLVAVMATCVLPMANRPQNTDLTKKIKIPYDKELSRLETVSLKRIRSNGRSVSMSGSSGHLDYSGGTLVDILGTNEGYPLILKHPLPEGYYEIHAEGNDLYEDIFSVYSKAFKLDVSKRIVEVDTYVLTCPDLSRLTIRKSEATQSRGFYKHHPNPAAETGKITDFVDTIDSIAWFAGYMTRKSVEQGEHQYRHAAFVNETGLEGLYEGKIEWDLADIDVVMNSLTSMGFTVTKAKRPVEAMVVVLPPENKTSKMKKIGFFDRKTLIKFQSDDPAFGADHTAGDTTVYSRTYDVAFRKGEKLLVYAELYQSDKPMRRLGHKIFEGSVDPQKLSVSLIEKPVHQAVTDGNQTLNYQLSVELGDEIFDITTVVTAPAFQDTAWDWWQEKNLIKERKNNQPISHIRKLLAFEKRASSQNERQRIWMPGYDISQVGKDKYTILIQMIPVSQLEYLTAFGPVKGAQLLDGSIFESTDPAKVKKHQNQYFQSVKGMTLPIPELISHQYYKAGELIKIRMDRVAGDFKPTLDELYDDDQEHIFVLINGKEYFSRLGTGPFGSGVADLTLNDITYEQTEFPAGRYRFAYGWKDLDVINPDKPDEPMHFDRLMTNEVEFEVVDELPADYFEAVYEEGWQDIFTANIEPWFTDDSQSVGVIGTLLGLKVTSLPFDIAFDVYAQAEDMDEPEYACQLARSANSKGSYLRWIKVPSLTWDNVGDQRWRIILKPSQKAAAEHPPIRHYYGRDYTTDWLTFEESDRFDQNRERFGETESSGLKADNFTATLPNSEGFILTKHQQEIVTPVFEDLADKLNKLVSKYPELKEYQQLNAIKASVPYATGDQTRWIELSYQHNYAAPRTKRGIQPSDFGEHGFYVVFKCLPISSVGAVAISTETINLELRNLGIWINAEVKTGSNPSPGLVQEVSALLQTHSKMLKEIDKHSAMQVNQNNFTATLPHGVTVELVGVCEHPSKDKQWWLPDGTLLDTRPYESSPAVLETFGYKNEFLFRVRAAEEPLVKVRSIPPFNGSMGPRRLSKETMKINYSDPENLYSYISVSDKPLEKADITLLIGHESEWITESTLETPSENSASHVNNIIFTAPVERDGQTHINVVAPAMNKESRIVAIDNDGKVYVGSGAQSDGEIGEAAVKSFNMQFPLPLKHIQSIQYQTQAYVPVTFRNVALRPGGEVDEDAGLSTREGLQSLVDKYFSENETDIVERQTIFAGEPDLWAGYIFWDYSCVATLSNGQKKVLHKQFKFDEQTGNLVSVKDRDRSGRIDPDLELAMAYDAERNQGNNELANRSLAVSYYSKFVQKSDIQSWQKAAVYNQLGAMYVTSMKQEKGELRDEEKARNYFRKVLEVEPQRIGWATIRARSMLSTLENDGGMERVKARMAYYTWLRKIDEDILKTNWLPSNLNLPTPREGDPTDNQLKSQMHLIMSLRETCVYNAVYDALQTPQEGITYILEKIPPEAPEREVVDKCINENPKIKEALNYVLRPEVKTQVEIQDSVQAEISPGIDAESEAAAQALEEILLQQREILQQTLETVEFQYEFGRIGLDEVRVAKINLLEVESQLAGTQEMRLEVLREIVDFYKQQEQLIQQQMEYGMSTPTALNEAKLRRLEAEKALLKAAMDGNGVRSSDQTAAQGTFDQIHRALNGNWICVSGLLPGVTEVRVAFQPMDQQKGIMHFAETTDDGHIESSVMAYHLNGDELVLNRDGETKVVSFKVEANRLTLEWYLNGISSIDDEWLKRQQALVLVRPEANSPEAVETIKSPMKAWPRDSQIVVLSKYCVTDIQKQFENVFKQHEELSDLGTCSYNVHLGLDGVDKVSIRYDKNIHAGDKSTPASAVDASKHYYSVLFELRPDYDPLSQSELDFTLPGEQIQWDGETAIRGIVLKPGLVRAVVRVQTDDEPSRKAINNIVDSYLNRLFKILSAMAIPSLSGQPEAGEIQTSASPTESELPGSADDEQNWDIRCTKRWFVTVIADEQGGVWYNDKPVGFKQLERMLKENRTPPNNTVLEVGYTDKAYRQLPTREPAELVKQDPIFMQAKALVNEMGFECLSYIGPDHPGDRRGPISFRIEDRVNFCLDRDIKINVPDGWEMLDLDWLRFEPHESGIWGKVQMTVHSHPKTKWEIALKLFDQDGGFIDSVFHYYENSGVIMGLPSVSRDELIFEFNDLDVEQVSKFEIEVRKYDSTINAAESIREQERGTRKPELQAELAEVSSLGSGGKTQSEIAGPDLVFEGTIREIKISALSPSETSINPNNYVILFQIEKVLKGVFNEETFLFRIHSPSRSNLIEGRKYRVEATKTENGYEVDEYQWSRLVQNETSSDGDL